MATPGRFQIKWHGAEVLRDIRAISVEVEKEAADRIIKRLQKKVPIGSIRRRGHATGKDYQTRNPGRLRRSIRKAKSKFKDGGYIVLVGGRVPFYAYWVEKGTVFTYRQKFGRRGEKFMEKSAALEKSRFIRNLRKRLGA